MRTRALYYVAAALTTLTALNPLRADVKPMGLFQRNMVLQRDMPVPVWGTADAGEKVTVQFRDQKVSTTADDHGNWSATLKPLHAGQGDVMTIAGNNKITLGNVAVGEVWVCSGQSNMDHTMHEFKDTAQDIDAANDPLLREFQIKSKGPSPEPQQDIAGWGWNLAEHKQVAGWSAVAYYFGRDLREKLDVPVGLVVAAVGGTGIESWASRPAMEKSPAFHAVLSRWDKMIADYPTLMPRYQKAYAAWQAQVEEAKKTGATVKHRPWPPHGPNDPHRPANLYDAFIAPLTPLAVRGVIWYQGEFNTTPADAPLYGAQLAVLIDDWRRQFNRPQLPFGVVQLPNLQTRVSQPGFSGWSLVREGQLHALSLPDTGLAVTIDIGDPHNIHPEHKSEVGRRLSLWALGAVYGQKLVYSGPIYKSMAVEGDKIRITFDHVDGDLMAKGGAALQGFAVAGADKQFVPADAVIDHDTVVVSSPKVAQPVAVRYAWADNPACNLYNKEKLPASPFRTDNW